MSTLDRPQIDHLMMTATRVLNRAWDANVTLYLQDPIRTEWGRHTLLLCHVDGPADAPTTVVIKAAVEDDHAIFNEWAVLEWLNGIDVAPLVPTLFGGDTDAQLIVIEDLGAGPSLHRVLQTRSEWAVDALVEGQQLLAQIHSATRGRQAELRQVRSTLPNGPPPPVIEQSPDTLRTEMEAWLPPPSSAVDEIELVSATLAVPNTFRSLTFNDACPVNRIVTANGVRAVDLEMAGFRHPMLDGAYAAIGHLRCVVRRRRENDTLAIPPAVRSIATDAYREAMIAGFPEYADIDRFHADLAAASAVWMVNILQRTRPGVAGDRPTRFFGVTACQRTLATLAAFSEIATTTSRLPALNAWAHDLGDQLESEWPELPPLAYVAGLDQ
ncbi:MAG: hypothetical protein U9N84_10325 [Actinomycetota bacterium]|nr:hypothetical protein [Actinomycetota bacterium]